MGLLQIRTQFSGAGAAWLGRESKRVNKEEEMYILKKHLFSFFFSPSTAVIQLHSVLQEFWKQYALGPAARCLFSFLTCVGYCFYS